MTSLSICVYCGSRSGQNPNYQAHATVFGRIMANRGWRLVYGAGDIGLMGAVANAAQDAGGDTFGVIPTHLLEREVGKTDLTRFIVTENMHERKKVMFMNSDAIVVLPGGAGSLDEFFEVLTWRQLGLHNKPIFLLNTDGYWNPLLNLMDHVITEGFAGHDIKDSVAMATTPEDIAVQIAAALFWPKRGIYRQPGIAVVEFLDPIETGVEQADFIARLEKDIEVQSNTLMREASFIKSNER